MSKFKEPKHAVVENGRKYRPHIKLAEGGVENIPFPTEQRTFDKVTASASLHHFPNQDIGLEEMKSIKDEVVEKIIRHRRYISHHFYDEPCLIASCELP